MEANNFIAKLKADGSNNDQCDLDEVYKEYRHLLTKVPSKDKGTFSLNVLCILCRNIDKIPSWRASIDNKSLLTLSIDCIRETRGIDRPNRVKTLSCIYHLHKYAVRQTTPLPPELVLKVSIMAFEPETKDLLTEYSKTYWNIIVDRMTYLGNTKEKVSLTKFLPKLSEDLLKVIEIYDKVLLCTNFLPFLLKKLFALYSDNSSAELNKLYGKIFKKIAESCNLVAFKRLQCKESLVIYGNINDCLYVITENSSKNGFKDFPLENIVRTAINMVGHTPSIFHCLQTFYLNSVCCIFRDITNLLYIEKILENILQSFEITEKFGYNDALYITYPFLGQFVKLYIEYTMREKSNEVIQLIIIQIIRVLMKKLRYTEQLLKCDNCITKTGLHDALRLSFQVKYVVTTCIDNDITLNNILPLFYDIVKEQYSVLADLRQKNCVNHAKCFRKLQTDVHNTAILLNKVQVYEYSRKLFKMYIYNEILHFKCDTDMKNIARALYNKSICQLDSKLYEDALIDVFLSQIFAQDLNTDKYMSLVMDIKAKACKDTGSKDGSTANDIQLMTVMDACKMAAERSIYGNLKPFLANVKFSVLLKHELSSYAKLWPSVLPVVGVSVGLLKMYKGDYDAWMNGENKNDVLDTLLDAVLETPFVVKLIQNENFSKVVCESIEILEDRSGNFDCEVAHATLLFLKSELEFAEAGVRNGWKMAEQVMNPDDFKAIRTYQQEYACIRSAMDALRMWLALISDLNKVTNMRWLAYALHVADIYVQQFLRLEFIAHGLQLAHICCKVADHIDDRASLCRNVGTILSFLNKSENLMGALHKKSADFLNDDDTKETFIVFICDCAIYYSRNQLRSVSLRLVQFAQSLILAAQESKPHLNLDLAIGRLLEAQMILSLRNGPSALTAANMAQRHYFAVGNTESKWANRRLRSLTVKRHSASCSVVAARLARSLSAWRRARAASGAALPCAGAHAQACLIAIITNPSKSDDAQAEIDNRLKHILGLQPSNETQPGLNKKNQDVVFAPKVEIETMLDNMFLKKTQCSPSIPCNTVQAFKIPEYLLHGNRCRCYACRTPSCLAMTCRTFCLEASMYFRAKEFEIAANYFAGVFKILDMSEGRLKSLIGEYRCEFDGFIVDIVGDMLFDELKSVRLQVLLDASYFELAVGNYEVVDSYVVNIHEIMQDLDSVSEYLSNDILNLMTASACLRKMVKVPTELGIEFDLECLTLSPVKKVEILLTPESKRLPVDVKTQKTVHKDEDIPKKRRVVAKFKLDESTNENEGKDNRKVEEDFKVPSLVVAKHVLEAATPIPKSVPHVLLTQPSQETISTPKVKLGNGKSYLKPTQVPNSNRDVTPRQCRSRSVKLSQASTSNDTPKIDFYTPIATSPEHFFTPMTSVKTYPKKSLRGNIVKNLEKDFVDKENLKEVQNRRRALHRATSPGKLPSSDRKTRRNKGIE